MALGEASEKNGGLARGPRALVLLLFFLSGISGLVYQVLWVRQFGNVFGNTLHSASLVMGVFMLGLGVGSYWLGRIGDRRYQEDERSPLRLYGYAELCIAAFGLLLAMVVPRLQALSTGISSYRVAADGFHELSLTTHIFRYGVAIALMAPPAILMGGTLTLLIRFVIGREVKAAGWRIGLLYGVNTAGAALGALLSDFLLVPALGIFATQLVAVAFNVVAGAGAWQLSRGPASVPTTTEESASASEVPGDRQTRAVALTAVAIGLSGFAAMGIEIVWFRYLGQVLGALRSVFSLMLAVILVGIWLGAILGGHLQRRFGEPVVLLIVAQGLLAASVLALLIGFDHHGAFHRHLAEIRATYLAASSTGRAWLGLEANLQPILAVTALPALMMGFTFPLANAHVQRTAGAVGGRAGALYLFNTLGNVLGSVLVGFWLLPAVGIRWSAFALCGAAALSVIPLWLSTTSAAEWRQPTRPSYALLASLLVSVLAGFAFLQAPADRLLLPAIPRGDEGGTRAKVLESEGQNETLVVIEIPGVERSLYTNGHPMSSTSATSQRYMRAFAHIPLLHVDDPTDVLVICFGVGNTLHAASLHPSVERLEVADLSRHVLEHAHLFSATNHDILDDPRVSVFVNDGRHHLAMQPGPRYDLITLEPPPIAFAGVSALYSREFYALARSRLEPGGFVSQWLPSYQVPGPVVLAMVRAFVEVFPASVLLSGDDRELILMGINGDELVVDPDVVAEKLRAAPAVAKDLERIYMGTPVELFGTFAASGEVMAEAVKGAEVVTDDRPLLEYAQAVNIPIADLPASLFDVRSIGAWCPNCASIDGLDAYLAVREAIYRSPAFLEGGSVSFDDPAQRAAIDHSEYLRFLLRGEPYHLDKLGVAHLAAGDLPAAAGAFRRALYLSPNDVEATFGMARALARAGDREGADAALNRVIALAPEHPGANAVLCRRAVDRHDRPAAELACGRAKRGGQPLSPDLERRLAELVAAP